MKTVSLIFSCYNEENCIDKIMEDVKNNLHEEYLYEIIFVNDGSKDNSLEKLKKVKIDNKKLEDKMNIKIISFSKNFGHEAAMLAGLDYAKGDYLIFLDCDGQHPINKTKEIIEKLNDGKNIISMVRCKNLDQNKTQSFLSKLFYRFINRLAKTDFTENASDFFAIDKKVVLFLRNNYREKVRFLRGIVQNIGFNKDILYYEAPKRISGKTHYSFIKLVKLAADTIFSYTNLPLHLGVVFGFFSGFLGVVLLIYTLVTRNGAPSGYATIIIFLCFMFAVLFLIIGIIGEYIAIIFTEVKDRPSYIIEDIL